MKIVIDTNTLVNAAGDEYNYGNRIIDAVLAGKIQAFANRQTASENRLIADRKVPDQVYREKLARFFDELVLVDSENVDAVEDREDNKILASAVAGGADFLVTSDWHLLKLGTYQGVRIVTPQGFWSAYEEETGQGWQNWLNQFMP